MASVQLARNRVIEVFAGHRVHERQRPVDLLAGQLNRRWQQ
ncbi:hypothetical protein [Streptomyces sp. NPDC057382]